VKGFGRFEGLVMHHLAGGTLYGASHAQHLTDLDGNATRLDAECKITMCREESFQIEGTQ